MKKLIAAVAAVVAAAGAQAAVITQSAPLTLATTEINQTFSFNQFNPALGTLTAVSLTLNGEAISSASLTNTAAQPQDFTFASNIRLRLSGTGITNTDLNLALFNYDNTILVGATADLGTVDKTGSTSAASPVLSAFTGLGNATYSCRSLVQNTQAGGGGNITVTQATTAGCGLTLVYTYDLPVTTVPEPTSLALVGLALAGLGYASRRKA